VGAKNPVPLNMAVLLNSRATNPLTSGWIVETYPLNSFTRILVQRFIDGVPPA
jgi:hypothetical protein